jgi:hypothetical protein
MLENEQELKGPGQDSGLNSTESFATYDRATSSWKTSQGSLFEAWIEYSETWPQRGMMRNGRCYPQPMSELPTSANGSGLLPTPTGSQARSEGSILQMRRLVDEGRMTEQEAEQMIGGSLRPARMKHWPTPRANIAMSATITPKATHDPKRRRNLETEVGKSLWPTPISQEAKHGAPTAWELETDHSATKCSLRVAVAKRMLPTPQAGDYRGPNTNPGSRSQSSVLPQSAHSLPAKVGGKLNPMWVEWLMGYPSEWTVLEDLETP